MPGFFGGRAASFRSQAIKFQPPNAPVVALTPSLGQISISWTDSNPSSMPVLAHKVYRSTSAGSETLVGVTLTKAPYVDVGLVSGTTYYYRLSALNAVGESALSSEVSAMTTSAMASATFDSLSATFDSQSLTFDRAA